MLQTYDEDGNTINTYTYGLQRIDSKGEVNETYLYDGRGSVVGSANENNEFVSYSYTAYGNLMPDSPTPNVFGYNGEATDYSTGLQYLRARYYDTTVQRFVQEDDYRGDYTNPASMNRYAYVHSNPVMGIDPSGYDATVNGVTYSTLADLQYACGQAWVNYQYYQGYRDRQNNSWDEYATAKLNYDLRKDKKWKERYNEWKKTGLSLNSLKSISNQKYKIWEGAKKDWDGVESKYWAAKKEYDALYKAAMNWVEPKIINETDDDINVAVGSNDGANSSGTSNNNGATSPGNQKTDDIANCMSLDDIRAQYKAEGGGNITKFSSIWWNAKSAYLIFPLYASDYIGGATIETLKNYQKFGGNRKDENGVIVRAHAGTDLLSVEGAEVLAMADGEVVFVKDEFIKGHEEAWQVVIETADGTTIRLAEFDPTDELKEAFDDRGYLKDSNNKITVEQGEVIGEVITVVYDDGTTSTMIHAEVFGTNNENQGTLTQSSNPSTYRFVTNDLYFRRVDLIDSSGILDLTKWIEP